MITYDEMFSYKTYGGCLTGRPAVQYVLDSVQRRIKQNWGERPVHIMPYEVTSKIDHRGELKERLPTWCHCYWFTSYTPVKNPDEHGSHLVVIYFSESSSVDVDELLKQIDWKEHAEDFSI